MIIEIPSGVPAKNIFALYLFFLAIGFGVIVLVLFLTKKRS